MDHTRKIKQAVLGHPEAKILEQVLTELKDCQNFMYFLDKVKDGLSAKNVGIITEITCAYRIKKFLGWAVCFIPEKQVAGIISPQSKEITTYSKERKPDLWVKHKGESLFIEVKKLNFDKSKVTFNRAFRLPPYDSTEEEQNRTSKILNLVEDGFEQIQKFGKGFVYIDCGIHTINVSKIKQALDDIFRYNKDLLGIILVCGAVKIDDYTQPSKTEVLTNPYVTGKGK